MKLISSTPIKSDRTVFVRMTESLRFGMLSVFSLTEIRTKIFHVKWNTFD